MKADGNKQATEKSAPRQNGVSALGVFGSGLLDIGWRLGITVIVFLWGGSWLDDRYGTEPRYTVIGFFLVVISFVLILRRVLQGIPRSQGGLKHD